MAVGQRRIGLKEVRALKPWQTVWDAAVVGFGARRQRSKAVSYVKLQNFALKVFIQEAFILAGWSRPFLSTKELNDHKKTFLDAIATIRAQAPILAQLPIHSSKMGLLHHLAAAYERAIEKLDPSYMIPVAKRPALGNPARRAYVLCMVALCRKIYGTPLYGTVANTANVVFKANLSSQQVREMTAGF